MIGIPNEWGISMLHVMYVFITTPVLCLSLLLLSILTRAQLMFFSSAALLLVKRGLNSRGKRNGK